MTGSKYPESSEFSGSIRGTSEPPVAPAGSEDVLTRLIRLVADRARGLPASAHAHPSGFEGLKEAVQALEQHLHALELLEAAARPSGGEGSNNRPASTIAPTRTRGVIGDEAEAERPARPVADSAAETEAEIPARTVADPAAEAEAEIEVRTDEVPAGEADGEPLVHRTDRASDGEANRVSGGEANHDRSLAAVSDASSAVADAPSESAESERARAGPETAEGSRHAGAGPDRGPPRQSDGEPGAGLAAGSPDLDEYAITTGRDYPPFRDQVTGLHSREGFDAVAGGELKRCRRYGRVYALLLFRVAGADLATLRRAANAVRAATRESDLVGRHLDGALAVALPETQAMQARLVAERIIRHFEGVGAWDEDSRIGLVTHPAHGETLSHLIEAARAQLGRPVQQVLAAPERGIWPD